MTERGMQIKSDMTKEGWERADCPIVCETCLGDNPFVRMSKEPFGKECKICERPFTVFRWRPGSNARYKKTEICQTCSKIKNVCQTCVLDLVYGLPVQVRDAFLAKHDPHGIVVPESEIGREYHAMQQLKAANEGDLPLASQKVHEGLMALARKRPYYDRNRAHLCSFFARGECKRGKECPYRHEMPRSKDDPLANQNIKDRFHGRNDPVAAKILARHKKNTASHVPKDTAVRKLWVGGLTEVIGRDDIQDALYSFGEITNIRLMPRQKCAFVEFYSHDQAKAAIEAKGRSLVVKGVKLVMNWAQAPKAGTGAKSDLLGAGSAPLRSGAGAGAGTGAGAGAGAGAAAPAAAAAEAYPGQRLGLPPPPGFGAGAGAAGLLPMPFAAGSAGGTGPQRPDVRRNVRAATGMHYPSMNPHAMGSRLPTT